MKRELSQKIGRQLVTQPGPLSNLLITSLSRSAGRLLYGPDKECDFGYLEAGQSVRELSQWPELNLKTAYSEAEVVVYSGVGFGPLFRPSPKIGTTLKGGPPIPLAGDGTPSQLSTTVIGTHGLRIFHDPRNHPDAIVWVSTHIDMLPEQKTPQGKPLPNSGPPGGTQKMIPLPHDPQGLQVEGFNSALWAWQEPGQNLGPVFVYFAKDEFGV